MERSIWLVMWLVVSLVVWLVACSPRTAPVGERAVAAGKAAPAALSVLGETCAATADCISPLHCIEAVCRSLQRSRLGDLMAGKARALSDEAAKVDAYAAALTQYATDEIDVPVELSCDAGAAFARRPDDKSAEQAARLLHRCTLGVPAGSTRYDNAMVELARLVPRGLEPRLVASETLADSYLTGPKAAPAIPTIKVIKASTDKGFVAFISALPAGVGKELAACAKASPGSPPLTFDLQLRLRTGDDDLVVGARFEAAAVGPATPASECVRNILMHAGDAWGNDRKNLVRSWAATIQIVFAGGVR
jgi:hypothetical protein